MILGKVYVLSCGSNDPGDEWSLVSIHQTISGALSAKHKFDNELHQRDDGSFYKTTSNDVDEYDLHW